MRSFRGRANAPAHRPAVRSMTAALIPRRSPGADAEVPKETGDGSAADARDQEQRFAYRCRDPDPPGRAPGGHEKIRQRLRATASGAAEDGAGSLFVLDEPCGVRKAVFPACGERVRVATDRASGCRPGPRGAAGTRRMSGRSGATAAPTRNRNAEVRQEQSRSGPEPRAADITMVTGITGKGMIMHWCADRYGRAFTWNRRRPIR